MSDLRAILVCVDYADLLAITLPYNRHHFREVHIVTSLDDVETVSVAEASDAFIWKTDLFYENGADFNKWLALETYLDLIGRDGWMCLMDADVLWPKDVTLEKEIGKLYSPLRHMFEDVTQPIPSETNWDKYPIHSNVAEWAGYTQIFHAKDPVLPESKHWHETNWKHAGGADSFFQMRWAPRNKVRPSFNCLHLGPAGANWCGRVTPTTSGELHPQSRRAAMALDGYLTERRTKSGPDRFNHEKLY